jgi:hypothetical protein
MSELYLDNSNLLELRGLKDTVTDAYINDAVVSATVRDKNGDLVTGETFPKTLNYMAASNGVYRATLAAALVIVAGEFYEVKIAAVGNSLNGAWTEQVEAKQRRFNQ